MQEDPAHQLHVEGPQAERATRALTAVGEGFGQKIVEAFSAFLHPSLEFGGLLLDALVRESLKFRLKVVDARHEAADGLHLAVVGRSEDLARERSETQHVFSAWSFLTSQVLLT